MKMIKGVFICNHCKKEKEIIKINEFTVKFEDFDIVYIPEKWVNFSNDRHLCKDCNKKYFKERDNFLKIS